MGKMNKMVEAIEPKSAKPSKHKEPEEYEISDAANTLMKAEEIKKNKHLMPHVHKHLKGKKKAIESIDGLRDKAEKMHMDSDGDYDND